MAFPSDTTRLAQGAEIEGSLTVARPVNTIVRDVATGELFVSTNAALAAYNQLTGTFSPTTFAGIGTTGYVPDPAAGTATRILSSDGNWGEPVVGGAAGGDCVGGSGGGGKYGTDRITGADEVRCSAAQF